MSTEQIEQERVGRGNTESRPSKQSNQYNYWFFTFNNYTVEQIEQLEQVLRHECKWYIFQEETGEEGTPHLQGTISLKVKQRLTQLKVINVAIHWEPTKCVKASIEYCTKYESRTGRIYYHGIEIPEPLDLDEPYGWQLEIMDIIKTKPDKRTLHWYWESIGNIGKSVLCKWLVVKHNALMVTGKSTDMYNMLVRYPTKRKIIICDIPRASLGYINYGAIEHIKTGLVQSGKYEGHQLVFNSPHIFVFANEPPDCTKASMDRWVIKNIRNEAL